MSMNTHTTNTEVTDFGLEHLKSLTSLQTLDLRRTNITDAELVHLEGLTRLRELRLDRRYVTNAGVKKLQTALPNCRIDR